MISILLRKRNSCNNTRKSLYLYTFVDGQITLINFTTNIYSQSWVLHSLEKKWDCNCVIGEGNGIFSSPKVQSGSEACPGLILPGVKWSGREADLSSACSAEVSNECLYNFTPPIYLQDVYRDNFNITLKELYQLLYILQDRLQDSHLPKTIT